MEVQKARIGARDTGGSAIAARSQALAQNRKERVQIDIDRREGTGEG